MLFVKDYLFVITALILTSACGLPFLFLISPHRFKYRYLILPTFGYGFIGFLATVAYIYGFNHHYPIYSLPYTFARTHYFPEGQKLYDWELSRFDSAIKKCNRVYINVTNQWQEHAIAFYLYSKRKILLKSFPYRLPYGQQLLLDIKLLMVWKIVSLQRGRNF